MVTELAGYQSGQLSIPATQIIIATLIQSTYVQTASGAIHFKKTDSFPGIDGWLSDQEALGGGRLYYLPQLLPRQTGIKPGLCDRQYGAALKILYRIRLI